MSINYSYDQVNKIPKINTSQFYELKFMKIYPYERELGMTLSEKIQMIEKITQYLLARNIHITYTDRILDDIKVWEREGEVTWRYLPIAELQGNNICINAREIDFLSILFSIGHIYGHLVQRMNQEKYAPITDFLNIPKPLNLELMLANYTRDYGRNYRTDFLDFEIEAFRYAKYAFMEAGIEFTKTLDYAMNVYIEADFNQLWEWIVDSPIKSGEFFMEEYTRLWNKNKSKYEPLKPLAVEVNVVPDEHGSLMILRDEPPISS